MSQHEDDLRLRHMFDHAREAVAMIRGRTRADLDRDRLLELALVRLVEIIGEAATRISPQGRAAHPHLPWPQVMGTRHRIVHGYDKVDLNILWDTITDDLPPLIAQLEAVLGPPGPGGEGKPGDVQ